MSTAGNNRRPLRLQVTEEQAEERHWKVRTQDGRVRGPLGIEQIRALAEVDILSPDAVIAPGDGDEDGWQPIEGHQVWDQVRTAFQRKKLTCTATGTPFPTDIGVGQIPLEITPAMQTRLVEAKRRETHKLWRGMMLGQAVVFLRCVREVAVLLAFLVTGDLLTAFVPSSLGIVKWGILMVVMAVALGYYVLKGLGK